MTANLFGEARSLLKRRYSHRNRAHPYTTNNRLALTNYAREDMRNAGHMQQRFLEAMWTPLPPDYMDVD